MSVKDFDKIFGIPSSIEEEKFKFVNRIEATVFDSLVRSGDSINYPHVFKFVCYQLGLDAGEFWRNTWGVPNLSVVSKKDFTQTLRVVIAAYMALSDRPHLQSVISGFVE